MLNLMESNLLDLCTPAKTNSTPWILNDKFFTLPPSQVFPNPNISSISICPHHPSNHSVVLKLDGAISLVFLCIPSSKSLSSSLSPLVSLAPYALLGIVALRVIGLQPWIVKRDIRHRWEVVEFSDVGRELEAVSGMRGGAADGGI